MKSIQRLLKYMQNNRTKSNQKMIFFFLATSLILGFSSPVLAHFGMLIPSSNHIEATNREISFQLSFSHPFAGQGMKMEKPREFVVNTNHKTENLLPALKPSKVMKNAAWKGSFKAKRPGTYHFWFNPKPYWEPAEDAFIVHYTKTVVAAFGSEQGWQDTLGLPAEIKAVSRPFGNYAGTAFSGQVLVKGKPAANQEVEIEYYNQEQEYRTPTDYHETMVVLTDENGRFHFTCPKAGWWGFAALSEADYKLKAPDGKMKPVEMGAVIWVYFHDWQKK